MKNKELIETLDNRVTALVKSLVDRITVLETRCTTLEQKSKTFVLHPFQPSVFPSSPTVISNLCSKCGVIFDKNYLYTCQQTGCPSYTSTYTVKAP